MVVCIFGCIIIVCFVSLDFEIGYGRMDWRMYGRTDNTCEYSNNSRVWVGLMDQKRETKHLSATKHTTLVQDTEYFISQKI